MRALQFATATVNLACQKAFLFLATHGPIFICLSSSSTLFQCGLQYCLWNCSPMLPLVVKMIGTKSIPRCWHRNLYLSVFVFSADLVPAFGLRSDSPHAPAPEWLMAFGSTMLTSKATLFGMKGLPQTCPSESVCLLLPFAEMPTSLRLLSTELVSRARELQLVLDVGKGHLHYFVVPVVGTTAFAAPEVYASHDVLAHCAICQRGMRRGGPICQ
jgi:hypothetical protein